MNTIHPKTGLFFGSFNPIHIGHLIIANYLVLRSDLEEIWFVVSPQNPLKSTQDLAGDQHRLQMVRLAIGDNPLLKACDIEMNLPRPSYTITTLEHLRELHPDRKFVLIMGGDNLAIFHKWKRYREILEQHQVYVYTRPDTATSNSLEHPGIKLFVEMQMDISATYIRECIRTGLSIQYLTPDKVIEYINSTGIYRE